MIRTLARSLARFFTACVLFVLILCAVEVGFRYSRLQGSMKRTEKGSGRLAEFVRPHETTFLEVVPLLNLQRTIGPNRFVSIRTNEFGVRADTVSVPKSVGTYRILCLGGIDLFGIETDQDQTVPVQLRDLFVDAGHHHVEVLNAACPGAGPLTNYLRLRQSLLVLQPDLVIYCMNLHDTTYDERVLGGLVVDSKSRPVFAKHPKLTGMQNSTISQICQEFATAEWLLGHTGTAIGIDHSQMEKVSLPVELETTVKALNEIKSLLALNGSRLIVSLIPLKANAISESDPVAALASELVKLQRDNDPSPDLLIHRPLELNQIARDRDVSHETRFGFSQIEAETYTLSIATFLATQMPEILQSGTQSIDSVRSPNSQSARREEFESHLR